LKTASLLAGYLARWAEPVGAIAARVPGRYANVFVVPALGESAALLDGYRAAAAATPGGVLCIVVVNASLDAEPAIFAQNQRLLDELVARLDQRRLIHAEPPVWFGSHDALDVLVVDRNSAGFRLPARQGVGLARRVGCDLATELRALGAFTGRLIGCTDADAVLPEDYFTRLKSAESSGASALVFPFRHEPCGIEAVDTATAHYELSLRYYVLGLASAGSPYAFQTLGSSLAIDVDAYAMVRGFPRLRAGEDFYVLCKLAKVAPILRADGEPITIAARRSARVPFGTGAGVAKLEVQPLRVYAPRCFSVLAAWLCFLGEFAKARDLDRARATLDGLAGGERAALEAALAELGTERALLEASRNTPGNGLLRRLHTWFDGFRTLKLIHALRFALPDVAWADALASAEFLAPARASAGRLDVLSTAMAALEHAAAPRRGPTLVD
jgi:hypothetical protein